MSCFDLSTEKWHMSDCVPGSIWQSETWKGECSEGGNHQEGKAALKVIFAVASGRGGVTDN